MHADILYSYKNKPWIFLHHLPHQVNFVRSYITSSQTSDRSHYRNDNTIDPHPISYRNRLVNLVWASNSACSSSDDVSWRSVLMSLILNFLEQNVSMELSNGSTLLLFFFYLLCHVTSVNWYKILLYNPSMKYSISILT